MYDLFFNVWNSTHLCAENWSFEEIFNDGSIGGRCQCGICVNPIQSDIRFRPRDASRDVSRHAVWMMMVRHQPPVLSQVALSLQSTHAYPIASGTHSPGCDQFYIGSRFSTIQILPEIGGAEVPARTGGLDSWGPRLASVSREFCFLVPRWDSRFHYIRKRSCLYKQKRLPNAGALDNRSELKIVSKMTRTRVGIHRLQTRTSG